jgi:hypothetical protein
MLPKVYGVAAYVTRLAAPPDDSINTAMGDPTVSVGFSQRFRGDTMSKCSAAIPVSRMNRFIGKCPRRPRRRDRCRGVAIIRDRYALDVFRHEIGPARIGETAVQDLL